MSRHRDPHTTIAGSVSSMYPPSMKLACIRDAEIAALVEDEKRLRAELNEAKADQRKAADAKDANLRVFQPASDHFIQAIFKDIDAAQSVRSAALDEMEALKAVQRTFGQKRDRLKQLDFELEAPEYRKELAALARQVDESAKGGSSPTPALKDRLEKRTAEKNSKESERKFLRDELAKSGDVSKAFTQAKEKLDVINATLDKLFAKKKSQKPQNKELDEINKKLTDARARRDELERELERVQKKLNATMFKFPPVYRADLIGKQGATLSQLQEDFGVAINMDTAGAPGDKGTALLIGSAEDVAACVGAMQSIVDNAERTRQHLSMKFDPAMSKVLIGAKGATIDRIQATSGAAVKIRDDEITFTGTTEAIQAAKVQIEEIIANAARVEISFDPSILDFVIGKGGATVRKIEQESGAKNVKVLRTENIVVISGNEAAVKKAEAMYREIIDNMCTNAFSMKADAQMIRAVIGTAGKTIREIEEATGASVHCGKDVISIRGTKEAVALARRQIEDVGRREEMKIPFSGIMYGVLTTPAPAMSTAVTGDGEAAPPPSSLTPLDAIKKVSKCDQVVALARESVVVLRGRREHVLQAKQLLEDLLRSQRPISTSIPIPDVLFSFFTKRVASKDKTKPPPQNLLSQLKAKHPKVIGFDLNREASAIIITAIPQTSSSSAEEQSDALQDAAAAVKEVLSTVEDRIRKVEIAPGRAGAVIGSGGKVVGAIQAKTQTDIAVHKDANVVFVFHEGGDAKMLDEAVAAILEAASAPPKARP